MCSLLALERFHFFAFKSELVSWWPVGQIWPTDGFCLASHSVLNIYIYIYIYLSIYLSIYLPMIFT